MFTDYFTVAVCYDDIKRGVTNNVSSIGKSETAKETTICYRFYGSTVHKPIHKTPVIARKITKATHSISRAVLVYSWGGSNLVPGVAYTTATAVSRTRYSFSHQLSCWC